MLEEKMTLKEKRAASDARILRSAIRCFGEQGYTHSTLSAIADGADVTGGLVAQRYATKELLFEASMELVLEYIVENFHLEENADARQCLLYIIRVITHLREIKPEGFRFVKTVLNSVDFPLDNLKEKIVHYRTGRLFNELKKAQDKGYLPQGELESLMYSFYVQVIQQVDTCFTYHLDMPSDEAFLSSIQYVDLEEQRLRDINDKIANSILATYDVFTFIQVEENTATVVKTLDEIRMFQDTSDARKMLHDVVEGDSIEEEKARMHDFYNLDNIDSRVGNKRAIACKAKSKMGVELRHMWIPISRDASGKITEILVGAQIVD